VLEAIEPIGAEQSPVRAALGRYLSAPALARRAAPPFSCSAMDGYAVRHADVPGPVELRVREVLYAGDRPGAPLGPGDAARIFTGAPLPEGADAVVREEATEPRGDRVLVRHEVRAGENVRRAARWPPPAPPRRLPPEGEPR
jgi:molybdopterin molybdotransferase